MEEDADGIGLLLADGRAVRPSRATPSDEDAGMPRVDDRRMISGIVHVLRSGGR